MLVLLKRAQRDDGLTVKTDDSDEVSKQILTEFAQKERLGDCQAWDFASAMETYIALSNYKETLNWITKYIKMPMHLKPAAHYGS